MMPHYEQRLYVQQVQ